MNPKDLTRPHLWQPNQDSENARTLLLLHGTGADENDLVHLGNALDPGANILSPRGLVNENGMNRFFIRFPDGRFDEDSIRENVHDLAEFIRAAAKEYGFSLEKLVAVGFSNGANTAGALITLHPELLAGIVAFGTTKAFVESPVTPDLTGKFVFIANGETDSYSPEAKTRQMVEEFRSWGADVQVLMHKGGHQITAEHVEYIREALNS